MNNPETKRCHFVPITYLDKFYQTVNNKKVLVAKSKLDGKIFHPSVTSICVRKHLYTLPGETSDDRQLIEDFYSENIENDYNKIYNILNKPKVRRISNSERELIITTIITLLFRNPMILDRFNEFWSESINRLYNLAENSSSRTFGIDNETVNIDLVPKKDLLKANKYQNKQIFNISHIKFAFRLIDIRMNDCITVNEIEDNNEYISSDNPVSYINPRAKITGMFDPTNYLRLPLNTKKCLIIYPTNYKDCNPSEITRLKIKSNSALLDTTLINRLQHFNANQIIIGSFKSIKNIDNQINQSEEDLFKLAEKVKSETITVLNDELRKRLDLLNNNQRMK